MTLLALAALELGQGVSVAVYHSLDVLRRGLVRRQRMGERSRRMVEQVHRDMERL